MKFRKVRRRKSPNYISKHEQSAINDIFEESEGDFTISLSDVPDATENAFELVDYKIDTEKSRQLWEEVGKQIANDFSAYLITIAAMFDGLKSAEEHLRNEFDMRYDLLQRDTLDQIEYALVFKLKAMVLDRLDLTDEQKKLLMLKFSLKESKNPLDSFKKFLSETAIDKEDSPYGLGLTRGLRRE